MVFVAVTSLTRERRRRMHNGHHIGVGEGRGVRMVIDREVGNRHRVGASAVGVLVNDVDEIALSEIAQEAFRIAPAAGDGAPAVWIHVYRMVLHGGHDVAAVVLKVGWKARPSRVWRGTWAEG